MLTELPRWFANPRQVYVTHPIGLKNLVRLNNGTNPCYVSQYTCPTKETMIVDKVLFELDSKTSRRIPYNDVALLKAHHIKNKIPYIIDFSAGKGFHFFGGIKPMNVHIHNKREVKELVLSAQLSLANHLGLRSLDMNTVGKLRLPIRLPTTQYVNKYGKKNGLYCIYVPPEQFDKGIEHIKELAKEPGNFPPPMHSDISLKRYTELIPKFEIKKRFTYDEEDIVDIREGILVPSLEEIGMKCSVEALLHKDKNPPHKLRLEVTAWLKYIGYRDVAIVAFFKKMNWKDWQYEKTVANVRAIKPRLPQCTRLREMYGESNCKDCPLGR